MREVQQISRRTWLIRVIWGSVAVWSELNFGLGRRGWSVAIGGRDLRSESPTLRTWDRPKFCESAWAESTATS
jgi:hypothetical protein